MIKSAGEALPLYLPLSAGLAFSYSYHDLGGDYFVARDLPEHRRRRALLQLERLGYRVTLEPVVT
jgi:hypothetical protein